MWPTTVPFTQGIFCRRQQHPDDGPLVISADARVSAVLKSSGVRPPTIAHGSARQPTAVPGRVAGAAAAAPRLLEGPQAGASSVIVPNSGSTYIGYKFGIIG